MEDDRITKIKLSRQSTLRISRLLTGDMVRTSKKVLLRRTYSGVGSDVQAEIGKHGRIK